MSGFLSSATKAAQGAVHDVSSLVTGRMTRHFEQSDLIVVTQAEAHFESHVVAYLLQHDTRVRAVVNDDEPAKLLQQATSTLLGAKNDKLEVLVCKDMCDEAGCAKILQGATYLVHAVAMNPKHFKGNAEEDMIKPSVDGTKCMLECAKKCQTIKKCCMISSCYALGDLFKEQGKTLDSNSWYDIKREEAAKMTDVHQLFQACNALGEKAAWDWHRACEKAPFPLTAVLPSYVIGPELMDVGPRGPNRFIVDALTGHDVQPLADMGWIDARDVAKAAIDCLQDSKTDGKRYIMTNGQFLYKDMINWARDISGISPSKSVQEEQARSNPNKYHDEDARKDLEVSYTAVESSVTQMLAQVAMHAAKHGGQMKLGGQQEHEGPQGGDKPRQHASA